MLFNLNIIIVFFFYLTIVETEERLIAAIITFPCFTPVSCSHTFVAPFLYFLTRPDAVTLYFFILEHAGAVVISITVCNL